MGSHLFPVFSWGTGIEALTLTPTPDSVSTRSGIASSFVYQSSHRYHYLLTMALPVPREKLPGVWHPFLAVVGMPTERAVGQTTALLRDLQERIMDVYSSE